MYICVFEVGNIHAQMVYRIFFLLSFSLIRFISSSEDSDFMFTLCCKIIHYRNSSSIFTHKYYWLFFFFFTSFSDHFFVVKNRMIPALVLKRNHRFYENNKITSLPDQLRHYSSSSSFNHIYRFEILCDLCEFMRNQSLTWLIKLIFNLPITNHRYGCLNIII